jgi:hypothetical protein
MRVYPAERVASDKGGYDGTCGRLGQAKLVMKNSCKPLLSAVSACREWRAKMCFERLRSCGKVNRMDHGNLLSRDATIRRIARSLCHSVVVRLQHRCRAAGSDLRYNK